MDKLLVILLMAFITSIDITSKAAVFFMPARCPRIISDEKMIELTPYLYGELLRHNNYCDDYLPKPIDLSIFRLRNNRKVA